MNRAAAAAASVLARVPRGVLVSACLLLTTTALATPGDTLAARLAGTRDGAPESLRADFATPWPGAVSRPRSPTSPLLLAAGGRWTFQDGPTIYETADGLGFIFADANDRAAKERAVARVHAEFRRLVAAVASAERGGQTVDYDLLEVRASSHGDGHRVILAPGDPGVPVSLPLLVRSPEMVALARPWIRARVRGVAYRQTFPRADLMLPGLL